MPEYDSTLPSKPPSERADALAVLAHLREAGHEAYFAGGSVRDVLLGQTPKDYDIATDAPTKRVRELFSNTQAVGAAFGVILVRHRKSVIEVATFRAEGEYLDGRRPSEVRFTNAQEDARRRDFTINGLFFDPIENRVIDYVGGQNDINARLIRAIGNPDERFEEDHLRLLRAVRFAARFGFSIEPHTHEAIRRHAGHLIRISPERIAEELRLMLTPPTRVQAYEMLKALGLLEPIFRFLENKNSATAGTQDVSVFAALAPTVAIPFGLALAAASLDHQFRAGIPVLEALGRKSVHAIVRALRQSLRMSNEESDQMQGTMEGLHPLLLNRAPSVAMMKRFLARPTAGLSRLLLEAIRQTVLDSAEVRRLQERLKDLESAEVAPAPLLTGDDLTAAGLVPGPVFKSVLEAVYDAQLEDRITSREQALAMALELAGRKTGRG